MDENKHTHHEHGQQAHHNGDDHTPRHDSGGNHGGGGHHDHHKMMVDDFRRRFWVSLGLTIPILLLSPMIQEFLGITEAIRFEGDLYVLFVLSSLVFFYGGYPFLKGFFEEVGKGRPGMMTLIAVAIVTAYVYSSAVVFGLSGKIFFWELATLVVVMLAGHWIEMKSVMGASKALEELAALMPSEAHRVGDDGDVIDVPISDLATGDVLLVKPGEKIPADGEIVDGTSSINESMLTGESVPVTRSEGEEVIGGSVNGEGAIRVRVTATGDEGFLSKVIDLVNTAQASKSRTQNLADRAAFWLTMVALGGGVATFITWFLVLGDEFVFALERTVTVMVIACPHALGLAIPLVVAVSTALGAGNGLLIRNRTAFEAARNLQAVVFDKTGTLTEGRFAVTDILELSENWEEKEILRLAAGVEANSEHPIGQGILASADKPPESTDFKSITGKGAQAHVDGKKVQVVSPGFLKENDITVQDERYGTLSEEGKTVVFVLVDDELAGAIAVADVIRKESKEAVAELKSMGLNAMMLTGDNRKVAKWVADEIGLDEYFAEVLPEQKSEKIKEVQQRGLTVAMTGDGVNDAPALAQADVGIAVGAGTDVAVETADIVLVRSNPMDVATIVRLSRTTYRKMIQNLWWAAGYNIVAIPVAAGVFAAWGIVIGPAVGAALMSVSTVVVAINARLLRL